MNEIKKTSNSNSIHNAVLSSSQLCPFPRIEPKTSIFQKERDNHIATKVSAP